MKHIRALFFQVRSNREKQTKVIELARDHFEKKEPLLILFSNKTALEYVDLLLWRCPKESFLPHIIKDEMTEELIVLTTSKKNFNNARTILNLSSKPISNEELSFTQIYELEDLSSTNKNHTAQLCYKAYKAQNFMIITI